MRRSTTKKRFSDAEWYVMEVLWSEGRPLTTNEVAERVPDDPFGLSLLIGSMGP